MFWSREPIFFLLNWKNCSKVPSWTIHSAIVGVSSQWYLASGFHRNPWLIPDFECWQLRGQNDTRVPYNRNEDKKCPEQTWHDLVPKNSSQKNICIIYADVFCICGLFGRPSVYRNYGGSTVDDIAFTYFFRFQEQTMDVAQHQWT